MPAPLEPIAVHITAGYPILYLLSWEEQRVESHLFLLATNLQPSRSLYVWTTTEGYSGSGVEVGLAQGDPIAALDFVIECDQPGIFVIKDFHHVIRERMDVVRRLRDVFQALQQTQKTLVILSPILTVPPELEKEITILDYPLPDVDEVKDIVTEQIKLHKPGMKIEADTRKVEALLRAFLGLTADEIAAVARKMMQRRDVFDVAAIDDVVEEKRMILRKSEILEFVPTTIRMRHVGGLDNFKRWAKIRALGFTDGARKFGLPVPKGVLITGISGCGKSLLIQALADMWHLPLLRLDMGRVFSGFAGTPEESLRRAILTVEAVAPSILWIDEIEMGISVFSDSVESGSTSRIFASFLTWMQEKKAPVFIAATANDIDRLPPEMIRKGRFDEVFFVDLPNQKEREEIFRIHLEKRGKSASGVSIEGLARSTNGYTGAEIEQGLLTAMFEAYNLGRELEISDIYRALERMVPLAITMKEQITKTKRWADNRAVKAT
ncbi:MAG: AAA family ATPase [Alphaproteobacteria bacterium]